MNSEHALIARIVFPSRRSIAILTAASLALSAATFAAGPRPNAQPSEKTSANSTLVVENAWTRATAPKAPVAGGFITVRNGSARADRLLSATSPDAERVEIHEMSMTDGVMRMRKLDDGLDIPANASTSLKPGGYHLMFIGPKRPFVLGETVVATLRFEHAGSREVRFEVRAMGSR